MQSRAKAPRYKGKEPCALAPWREVLIVCGLLTLAVVIVYGQTVRHDFVNFDDDVYVYENPHVQEGLSVASVTWAFTQAHVSAHWHPLTWLSLMADAQAVKLARGRPDRALLAAEMHGVNAALHAVNSVLLFLVLRAMTASVWRSACVAALFAVHPLHVESVAWVTERKDMLSGLFGLLAIRAYVAYVRKPVAFRYALVALALALGLLAKPMLVTWPFVFLLLDYWPLGRWGRGAASGEQGAGEKGGKGARPRCRLVSLSPVLPFSPSTVTTLLIEKLPLLALVAASAAVTFFAQRAGGALISLDKTPLAARFARAAVLYAAYLGKTVWPARLASVYPDVPIHSAAPVAGAVVLLAAITLAALAAARRGHGYAAVGWFWFVGTLAPTIGLVQAGLQVMADRFVYLPQIGLFVAAVWCAAEIARRSARGRPATAALAAAALASLTACAWGQASVWRDGVAMWGRAVACTQRNVVALHGLGVALANRGEFDQAIVQYRRALGLTTDMVQARNNLGYALARTGHLDDAVVQYQKALAIEPKNPGVHYNLGMALSGKGKADAAAQEYHEALALDPEYAAANANLAKLLASRGKFDEAIERCRTALEIDPQCAEAYGSLGYALCCRGRGKEAIPYLEKAVAIRPDDAETLNNLAWLRSTSADPTVRDGGEAVRHALRAAELTPDRADALDTLAAAYAETGEFGKAAETARKAADLAAKVGDHAAADGIKSRLRLYEAGRPYREAK